MFVSASGTRGIGGHQQWSSFVSTVTIQPLTRAFMRSKQIRMAETMSSSDTVMTSSTQSLTTGHVRSPSRPA